MRRELVHVLTHHGPAQIAALLVTLFSILPAPGMLPKFGQDGDKAERGQRQPRTGRGRTGSSSGDCDARRR